MKNPINWDPDDKVNSFVKQYLEKKLKEQEAQRIKENIYTFIFYISVFIVFIIALHNGFNICFNTNSNCKNTPEKLMFQPREKN